MEEIYKGSSGVNGEERINLLRERFRTKCSKRASWSTRSSGGEPATRAGKRGRKEGVIIEERSKNFFLFLKIKRKIR
jgi:hypothetical protein